MTIIGTIHSGAGKGAFFMQLDWVVRQCELKLGFVPYPGTLNLRVRDAGASLAFFSGLGLPVDGDRVTVGASAIRVIPDPSASAGDLEGPGYRYVTIQVERADDAHREALAAGGREGMAPRTLGEVARISFVIEPGGNWIELSQRASIVGRLDP